MRLDPYAREFDSYTEELDGALANDTSRLYLDTSLLMWLIRVGREARTEFIEWCAARPAGTVRVPVWAAHELHRHLIRGTIGSNVRSLVSDAEKKLVELAVLANERADDITCQAQGYSDRGNFVATVELTLARMKTLSNVVSLDQHLSKAADEVVAFVNDHVLNTDLAAMTASLSATGEFRFSHLVPPGYLDRKDENKFGDVVIWEEILADLPAPGGPEKPDAILISRDEKTDWVSSAPMIRQDDTARDTKSNRARGFDVTRPHPLLVHEFSVRTGGGQLYVVHPGVFAAVLDYGVRKHGRAASVTNLLMAAYRPEFLDHLAVTELAKKDVAGAGMAARRRGSPDAAFVALKARDVMRVDVTLEMQAYNVATPPEQNQLVQTWAAQLASGAMAPGRFGRLGAELAVAGRAEWRAAMLATIENLASQLTVSQLNYLIAGLIYTAFFDIYGEPLRLPVPFLTELVLALEPDERFAPAFASLKAALDDKEVGLPYMPGSGRKKVPYTLDLASENQIKRVRDVRIANQSVLLEPLHKDAPILLSALLDKTPEEGATGKDLRGLLSRSFLIPFELLDNRYDKQRITWSPSAGLVTLDTGSPGGLSAVAEDGDEGE